MLLLSGLFLPAPILLGIKVFAVLSGSMEPALPVGSLIYVREIAPERIVVGDVITYTLPGGSTITHRVINIVTANQIFITKGDVNRFNDAPAPFDRMVGKVMFSLPGLGYMVLALRGRAGVWIILGVVALLGLSIHLPSIFKKGGSLEEKTKHTQ